MSAMDPRQMSLAEAIERAGTLQAAGQAAQACDIYKDWIAHHDGHPGLYAIHLNHAVCLADAKDLTGAVKALRAAIRLNPEFCPPYINLGGLLERLGRRDAAVAAWSSLVAAFPSVTADAVSYKLSALRQIGRVLEAAHAPAAAEAALQQSLEIAADQPDVIQHWIAIRQGQCKWPIVPEAGRVPRAKLLAAISPLSAACLTDDPMFQLANACQYNRRQVGLPPHPRRALAGIAAPPRDGQRLRIGYVSSDLRQHAVGFAMTDVLETHDRDRCEIFAYYCGVPAGEDDTQRRIRRAVEHWTDIGELDDVQAARRIRQDGIDVLVDLNGYTKDARTGVFALRPAPVAVNWFGFPSTMGSPYHHYIVADQTVIPPEHERYFSEQVVRVPCYQANDRRRVVAPAPPTRAQAGLPEGAVVFCCLNGMQKITQPAFERWLLVLRHVPDSVLWLLGGTGETQDRLRQIAQSHGIAGARLIFADKQANPEHLARLQLADLFLDSFPYGAHTTASDALWMGVPVLTLTGRSFAGRVCASVVRAAGLAELVCETPDAYVRLAVALGQDRARLAALRQRLRDGRDTCVLFDTPLLVRHLEQAFQAMHAAAARGEAPCPDLSNLDLYHQIGVAEDLERSALLDGDTYRARYRDRLADIDAVAPIRADARLWQPG